jgi:hypothetical protein
MSTATRAFSIESMDICEAAIVSRTENILTGRGLVQFFAGTLFVTCTPREAALIETMIIDEYKCGVVVSTPFNVVVSPMRGTNEFAFDLV